MAELDPKASDADKVAWIKNYYKTKFGLPDHQAAAMAGHLVWESGANPTNVGDGGLARGAFQWHPDRYANLNDFAATQHADPRALQTQLDFSHHEMTKGTEQDAGKALFAAPDLTSANKAMMGYLRPAGYTPAHPEAGHGYAGRLALSGGTGGDASAFEGGTKVEPEAYGPPASAAPPLDFWGRVGANFDNPDKMKAFKAGAADQAKAGAGLLASATTPAPAPIQAPQAHIPQAGTMPPPMPLGVGGMGGGLGIGAGMAPSPLTPQMAPGGLTPAQAMLMRMGFNGMSGGGM